MAYCTYCGQPLRDGANFCRACGTQVQKAAEPIRNTAQPNEPVRKIIYSGEIHKCPSCGMVLESFLVVCPSCGYELRGASSSNSIREFSIRLNSAQTPAQRLYIIQNYPVPNTKEDILEFMILAASNFDARHFVYYSNYESTSSAWLSKIEQCFQKASLVLVGADLEQIQQIYRGVMDEIARERQAQAKLLEKKEENRPAKRFKRIIFRTIFIIYCFLIALFTAAAFGENEVDAGIIGIITVALTITALLMSYGIIKKRTKHSHSILAIAALLLLIPFCFFAAGDWDIDLPENYKKDLEPIIWSDFVLGIHLPELNSSKAKVFTNNKDQLSLYFYKIDESTYKNYVLSCEDYGFSIDTEKSKSRFSGYNKLGYHLTLDYNYDENRRLSIKLEDPIKNETINWPNNELTKDLPIPKALIGEVDSESRDSFSVYLTNIDKSYFNEYITLCTKNGFDVDYYKGDDYFYAYNEAGSYLSIDYKGFNTMLIHIYNYDL
ncbi:MAG: zinc ribbon domain-containing protein [Ruminococcaceae bacterium]|nr:zinc ribbon domain-containing protein [Oscillospiraceae bacterium]